MNSRSKGARGEREVAGILREYGKEKCLRYFTAGIIITGLLLCGLRTS